MHWKLLNLNFFEKVVCDKTKPEYKIFMTVNFWYLDQTFDMLNSKRLQKKNTRRKTEAISLSFEKMFP